MSMISYYSASGAGVYCLDSHEKRLVSGGADNKAFIWNITVTGLGVTILLFFSCVITFTYTCM